MAEQFLNGPRIWPRLLQCRGLMQVFCPGILYLLPLLLLQRRVEAAPWPSAHFMHGRLWPRASSLCTACKTDSWRNIGQDGPEVGGMRGSTHSTLLSSRFCFPCLMLGEMEMAQKLWQCHLAPSGMCLSSPHWDCTPVLAWSPQVPGTDLPSGAPKACPCKPGWILHGLLRQVPRLWQWVATCMLGKCLIMICHYSHLPFSVCFLSPECPDGS